MLSDLSKRLQRFIRHSKFGSESNPDRSELFFDVEALEDRVMLAGDVGELVLFAGFEDVSVGERSFAFFSEVSGFTATGQPVEVQNNHPSVGPASQGKQLLELDGVNGVYAQIETHSDLDHQLRFDFSPRPGVSFAQNAIEVWWNGSLLETISADGTKNKSTRFQEIELTLADTDLDLTRLEFRSNSPTDNIGLGGLIDNVRVNRELGPLELAEIDDQILRVGDELDITAMVTDNSITDGLTYSLLSGPDGISIDPVTGVISWTASQTNIDSSNADNREMVRGHKELLFQAGFEDVDVPTGGYGFFNQVSGFFATGNPVEVQNNFPTIGRPSEGHQNLELDGLNGIFRDIATNGLDEFELVLDYSPRPGVNAFGNAIEVWWDGQQIDVLSIDGSSNKRTAFKTYNFNLPVHTTDTTRLEFRSNDPADKIGLGGLLDNVNVYRTPVTEVVGVEGKFEVVVRVVDEYGREDTESFTICIDDIDLPPVFDELPAQIFDEGLLYEVTLTATDPDSTSDQLVFELLDGPALASIDPATGRVTWLPDESDGPGEYEFSAKVTDETGLFDTINFSVVVNEVNERPILEAIPDQTVLQSETLEFTAVATDVDLPPNTLTYSLTGQVPPGATIDPISGEFYWAPTRVTHPAGIYEVYVMVSDGNGGADTRLVNIEVVSCPFDSNLTGWSVSENGGQEIHGSVSSEDCIATLIEGDSFETTLETTFVVPAGATELSFVYGDLSFDTSDEDFINDAFEVSLVDSEGRSLVTPYANGRDAFFNISEDLPAVFGSDVTVDGETVTVDLSGVLAGEVATLIFRLANDDSDTQTSVKILEYDIPGFGNGPMNGDSKFYVVDSTLNSVFGYDTIGGGTENFSLDAANIFTTGTTTNATGDLLWTVDGTSGKVNVYGGDGTRLGEWTATGIPGATGIATDGDDIWIVDATNGSVLQFVDATLFTAGTFAADASFVLDAANTSPSGITTDGNQLWIVDDFADAVFVYGVDGTLAGSWTLDVANSDASGITNDANGGNSLWTVDRSGTVFHYANSVVILSGAVSATSSFDLNNRNIAPEGIADPPQSADGDSLLDDSGRAEFDTLDDFEDANFFSVNTADVPGSITLNAPGQEELFPFIWIANFGEGTVSKFDVRTGEEIGRYRTGSETIGGGFEPSRVAVDGEGNVWVANRANGRQASIVKVLNEGFIDRNGNGLLDTGFDSNSDGQVTLDEVMAWDANGDGLPDDERIVMSVNVGRDRTDTDILQPGGLARAIAIDANDNIWVGLYNFYQYEVYDSQTGDLIDIVPTNGRPYGAAVDGSGNLWGATIFDGILDRIDIASMETVESIGVGQTYGVTIAPDGIVWGAGWDTRRIYRYDPATGETLYYGTPNGEGQIRGVAVDRNGDVWASSSNWNRVIKFEFDTDGKTLLNRLVIGVGSEPTAVVMDADGFIWTTARGSNEAWKIDPNTNTVVDGWPITTGSYPYNYSDMTGVIRLTVTQRRGTWTEIIDSESNGTQWGAVAATGSMLTDENVRIRVRSSNDRAQLAFLAWNDIQNGEPLFNYEGRYVEVEFELSSDDPTVNPSVDKIVVQSVLPPAIEIDQLVNDEMRAVGTVLIQGQASAFAPTLTEFNLANQIVSVRMNGTAVNILDANGRFFAEYDVQPGWNEITIEALDIYGLIGTKVLRVFGETSPPTIDFDRFVDISGSFSGVYGRTSFDERSETLFVDLATRNDGVFSTDVPLYVGVKNISDPLVEVVGADGVTPNGIPFYDFSQFVDDGRLDPNELTSSPTIAFLNPGRVQFDYELVFYTRLNEAPEITSLPRIEALAGRTYEYDVNAIDDDNDVLSYKLTQAPSGMLIDAISGVITWDPSEEDIGNYDIAILVDDGRGGKATQRFVLSVIEAPPNRPPVITSNPVTVATVVSRTEGSIVLANDEWTLSNQGFAASQDTTTFVQNIANFFTDAPIGKFLTYSNNFGLTGASLAGAMADAGHEWVVSTTLPFTLETLQEFDGVFVGGFSAENYVLIDYVQSGGNVYLMGGSGSTGSVGPAATESATWAEFLNTFGLKFAATYRNSGIIPINATPHPIFDDVTSLFQDVGQPIQDLDEFDDLGFIVANLSQDGLYAIFDGAQTKFGYTYQVNAFDQDGDQLHYQLEQSPSGMWIDPDVGIIRWGPTIDQVGNHDVTVRVEDGRGGVAEQTFVVAVKAPLPGTLDQVVETDLTIGNVQTDSLVYDPQLLSVHGEITATIANLGPNVTPSAFDVSFFEDLDGDATFTEGVDNLLGQTHVAQPLAANEQLDITASLSGIVQFANTVIYAFVDSGNSIEELNEDNNIATKICEFVPEVGGFDPEIEWNKSTFAVRPTSNQVMMTPAVADINQDNIPDIVFSTFVGNRNAINGTLRAISGLDGADIWTIDNSAYEVRGASGVAIGDIDLDGLPEIIAVHESDSIIVFEHDGQFKWQSSDTWGAIHWGGPSIADIDQDGVPEIIVGASVLDNLGNIVWEGNAAGGIGRGDGGVGPLSLVADIDLDGSPEIVAGTSVYENDGTLSWNANLAISDGFPAIGSFDDDDFAEIVVVGSGVVYVLEHDGQIKWGPIAVPGGGSGPPTIADVDGDGQPEIGIAGSSQFVVIETDGTIKWQSTTQDFSSFRTGSSVFDFEGDGKAELIYADETMLRIYAGDTGDVLFQVDKGSGTTYEMPLIVDIDADGNAEIVAVANSYAFGNKTGIYVFGDSNDTWVSTRQIWNQHTYHITNVNDDATIPQFETPSWLDHNSYRLNAFSDFTGGNPFLAPDLSPSFLRSEVTGDIVELTVRVGNGGSALAPANVDVAFYNGDPENGGILLGTTMTSSQLTPGQFEDVSINIAIADVTDLWIVVDSEGRVSECDELNNIYHPQIDNSFVNSNPVFDSTPTTNATEGREYRYDFSATDPDSDTLTFSLADAPAGMAIVGNALVWTPAANQSRRQTVQLVVSDGNGGTALQFFAINVANAINTAPFITSTPSQLTINVGQPFEYQLEAIDDEGDRLSYALIKGPEFMRLNAELGTLTWIPLRDHLGRHNIILQVKDTSGAADVQVFELNVVEPNLAPLFVSQPNPVAVVGSTYVYQVEIFDGNAADLVTLSLEQFHPEMQFDANLGLLTWAPTAEVTDQVVRIRATDDAGASSIQEFTVSAITTAPNADPQIVSAAKTTVRFGALYGYAVSVEQEDADALTYSLDVSPDGMTIDDQGVVRWENIPAEITSYNVTIRAEDARGGFDTQSFALEVVDNNRNSKPTIVSTPPGYVRVDELFVYDLAAVDAEGDLLTWRIAEAPGGALIDSQSGMLRWLPSLDQVGVRNIIVEVTDTFGATSSQQFEVQVTCVNHVPIIDSIPGTEATTGRAYFYGVRATDPDGQSLEFSLLSAPDGMTIDSQSGLIRWTPAADLAGTSQTVLVQAIDPDGGFATQQYEIEVADGDQEGTGNSAPIISSTPVFVAEVDQGYLYNVAAIDPDGDSITYGLLQNPNGMTIDPITGQVTWRPTAADVTGAPIVVVVAATDANGAIATQGFSIDLRENAAPEITSTPKLSATAGGVYRYTVLANDPDGDELNFELTNGPDGMAIDQFGRIVWTTPSDLIVGSFVDVEIQVSDSRGAIAIQSFSIEIVADSIAPNVGIRAVIGSVTYVNDPRIDVGSEFVLRIAATDNIAVTKLELFVDGQLVPLSSANEAIISASTLGAIDVLAVATDAAGNQGEATMTITVVNPGSGTRVPNDPTLPPVDPFDPTDNLYPFVKITSPAIIDNQFPTVTTKVDVIGTVDDLEDNLWYYRVYYARADLIDMNNLDQNDPDWIQIGEGTEEVFNGKLAEFDATLLQNNQYAIIVVAFDNNAQGWIEPTLVNVEGNLKVGNFRLDFVDLNMNLVGIPISVVRVYETFAANQEGDFGFGWSLGVQDANILETAVLGSGGGFTSENTLVPNISKVYLTDPVGQRVGFTYREQLISASLFGGIWRPYFEADAGVFSTLTIDETQVARGGIIGALAQGINPDNYILTTKDGLEYRYHETEGLESITDRNENSVSFSEDGILHSSGVAIEFQRDHRGRIKHIVDPAGNAISYDYNLAGDLVRVTDRVGAETAFSYLANPAHFLNEYIDELGRIAARNEYDDDGRLIATITSEGNRIEFDHNLSSNFEIVRDFRGLPTTFFYDDRGNVTQSVNALGETTSFAYDSDGNLLTETNGENESVTMTYDDFGNTLTRTDHLGNETGYVYESNLLTAASDPKGGVYTYEYDSNGNLMSDRDANGNSRLFSYFDNGSLRSSSDREGNVTQFEYDATGNLAVQIDPLGHRTEYSYDLLGNRTSTTRSRTDENGIVRVMVSETEFDADGRITMARDIMGNESTFEYRVDGRLAMQTDIRGITATHQYNTMGDRTRSDYSDGSYELIEYDANGNVTMRRDRSGNISRTEFDDADRENKTIDQFGRTTLVDYDQAGRRKTIESGGTTAELQHDGGQVFAISPFGDSPIIDRPRISHVEIEGGEFVVDLDYDANGNITSVNSSDGKQLNTTFTSTNLATGFESGTSAKSEFVLDANGQPNQVTDQNGVTYIYERNGIGQIIQVTDPLGSITLFEYDELGNKLSQTDAANKTTRWEYDDAGHVTKRILPGGQFETFVYNLVGDLLVHTNFNGERTEYEYDLQGRVTKKSSLSDGRIFEFDYDASGRLAEVLDSRGSTEFDYDEFGRIQRADHPDGSFIEYGYDDRSNRSSITTASGSTTYSYDTLNRLSTVTDFDGAVTNYSYDTGARTSTIEYANGTSSTTILDASDRISTLVHRDASGVAFAQYDVTYETSGVNERVINELDGREVTYVYDELHRLVEEQIVDSTLGNETIRYTYDSVGNRVTKTDSTGTISYTYDDNHRLLTAGDVTYGYDNNGNVISKVDSSGTTTYTFNSDNQLVAILLTNGIELGYEYDHTGTRVSESVDGLKTTFLTDSQVQFSRVLEEVDSAGVTKRQFVYGDRLLSQTNAGGQLTFHSDTSGSTRVLTDESGKVVDSATYDAFGNNLDSSLDTEYGFLGEPTDSLSGLTYLRARHLDSSTGRFVSIDPFEGQAESPFSIHPYLYGNDDPTSFSDPSGNFPLAIAIDAFRQVGSFVTAVLGANASRLIGPGGTRLFSSRDQYSHLLVADNVNLTIFGGFGSSGISTSVETLYPAFEPFGICNGSQQGNGNLTYLSAGVFFAANFGPSLSGFPGGLSGSATTGVVYNVCDPSNYSGVSHEGALSVGNFVLWDVSVGIETIGILPDKYLANPGYSSSAGVTVPASSPFATTITFAIRNYWQI